MAFAPVPVEATEIERIRIGRPVSTAGIESRTPAERIAAISEIFSNWQSVDTLTDVMKSSDVQFIRIHGHSDDTGDAKANDDNHEAPVGNTAGRAAGCAAVISHDRWFLDRVATHLLAFEGDSRAVWFDGNYSLYEENRRKRLGIGADQPHRIKHRRLMR